jgi:hypothetical protein
MAGAHPHYRSLRSTSPVILTDRQARDSEQDVAGCMAAMRN